MTLRTITIIALCLVCVALRFWRLTDSCLWFDEIFSVHAAEHSWSSILNFVALDLIHPPLFYVLLKIWIGVGGESVFWLRLLPVLFATVGLFPFISLCRELKIDAWTTALALFLFAVNGSLIKYSQEVRMYSLLMCLSLFSMWLFARYFYRGKSFAALAIVNILLVWTHYFGWFVIVSEVAAILIFQRIKWWRIALMFGVTLASFVPWLIAVISASKEGGGLGQNIGWMSRPAVREVLTLVLNLIEPLYYRATSAEPVSMFRISLPILLIVTAATVLYAAGWKNRTEVERSAAWLQLIFFKLPIIVAFVASWLLPYSIWGTRHLIIVFAPFSILTAIAVTNIPVRSIMTASITLLVLFIGYAFAITAERQSELAVWCGFDHIAKRLEQTGQGPIYVFEDLAAYHLWFAFRKDPDDKMRQRVVKFDNFPEMYEDKAYFLPRGLDDEYVIHEPVSFSSEQMWIVYRSGEFNRTLPPLSTFIANGFEITRQEVYGSGSEKIFSVLVEKR